MSEYVKIKRCDYESLISLLQIISNKAGTVYWEMDCGEYLEQLDNHIKNLKVEHIGE